MTTTNDNPPSQLRVARPWLDVALAIFGTTLVSTFVILAARNLIAGVAVVPSALWVGIVACVLIAGVREHGVAGHALDILGAFSRTQVLVVRTVGGSKALEIGFRLFGISLTRRRVPAGDLVSIGWSAGQASDMAGRDANDWSVALWYAHHDARREAREKAHRFRRPGQVPLIVGPPGGRLVTEALGERVLRLLQDADVSVTPEGGHNSPRRVPFSADNPEG